MVVIDVPAVSTERAHCSVGPRRAQMDATVVPQGPAEHDRLSVGDDQVMPTNVMPHGVVYRRFADAAAPVGRRRLTHQLGGRRDLPNTMSSSILSRSGSPGRRLLKSDVPPTAVSVPDFGSAWGCVTRSRPAVPRRLLPPSR